MPAVSFCMNQLPCSPSGLRNRLASSGTMVNETSSEASTVNTTASGMPRMNLPGMPGRNSTGRNAKIRVAVQPSTATPI